MCIPVFTELSLWPINVRWKIFTLDLRTIVTDATYAWYGYHLLGESSGIGLGRTINVNSLCATLDAPKLYQMSFGTRKSHCKRVIDTNKPYGEWLWLWYSHVLVFSYVLYQQDFMSYLSIENTCCMMKCEILKCFIKIEFIAYWCVSHVIIH